MDIQKNKIIEILRKMGVEHELGGLIYAICELRIIQLTVSNNHRIISSETRSLDKEYKELYETIKARCQELNIKWEIIENALSKIEETNIS
ncbi:MAG: hypothetical protein Q4A54_09330 [Parabacteroides sp.]|nr:hypothetical protein [Parabacteroides sp.]